jgi:hypothetical protein
VPHEIVRHLTNCRVVTSFINGTEPRTGEQSIMTFREWITRSPKDHFGAQYRIECPKCGKGMDVMRRLIGPTQGELQTLECLKCRHTQTRTVGG